MVVCIEGMIPACACISHNLPHTARRLPPHLLRQDRIPSDILRFVRERKTKQTLDRNPFRPPVRLS